MSAKPAGSAVVPFAADSPYEEKSGISTYVETGDVRTLTPSEQMNAALHDLVEKINQRLFIPYLKDKDGTPLGQAPECILTIESSGRHRGFNVRAAWSDDLARAIDQITLTFSTHEPGDTFELGATVVHELMHAKENEYCEKAGKNVPSGNYHSRRFSDWMKSVGIQTSKPGEPDGEEIGTGMSQYVIAGGHFERVMNEIIAEGLQFPWDVSDSVRCPGSSGPGDDPEGGVGAPKPKKPKDKSKTHFQCPVCKQNAWGNYDIKLACFATPKCGNVPMESVTKAD